MTTKKILITGFSTGMTEAGIQSLLGRFGPVAQIDIIRDGNAADPIALVEMAIDDEAASYLVARLSDYWHEGAMVNARLLHH